MKYLPNLISKLQKSPLLLDDCLAYLEQQSSTFHDPELEFELLLSNGFPVDLEADHVVYRPAVTHIDDQVFCIVDIEATHGKVTKGQVLEVGAVKYKNGQIIDKFDSLVHCTEIPRHIQGITGISLDMVEDAPLLKDVLTEFKTFLGDDVFVAHAIKFDYNYISDSFALFDLGELANAKLCTIDLAKRVIESEKYGLKFLKELLDINIDNHHRAYSDALSSAVIFERCIKDLPHDIQTTDQLIKFSQSNNIKNNSVKKN